MAIVILRPVTSLGHQERGRVFWEGTNFFELSPILSNYIQHIFPRRAKIFWGGFAPPGYGSGYTTTASEYPKLDLDKLGTVSFQEMPLHTTTDNLSPLWTETTITTTGTALLLSMERGGTTHVIMPTSTGNICEV